jgi:hypothetical protein
MSNPVTFIRCLSPDCTCNFFVEVDNGSKFCECLHSRTEHEPHMLVDGEMKSLVSAHQPASSATAITPLLAPVTTTVAVQEAFAASTPADARKERSKLFRPYAEDAMDAAASASAAPGHKFQKKDKDKGKGKGKSSKSSKGRKGNSTTMRILFLDPNSLGRHSPARPKNSMSLLELQGKGAFYPQLTITCKSDVDEVIGKIQDDDLRAIFRDNQSQELRYDFHALAGGVVRGTANKLPYGHAKFPSAEVLETMAAEDLKAAKDVWHFAVVPLSTTRIRNEPSHSQHHHDGHYQQADDDHYGHYQQTNDDLMGGVPALSAPLWPRGHERRQGTPGRILPALR